MGWARILTNDLNAFSYLPFFMSHRGDSGVNQIPAMRMNEGMKAEPSCSRQEIRPVSLTMTLAQKPRKIPARISFGCDSIGHTRLTSYDP